MHIKLISENDHKSRLANKRCIIMKDSACEQPDENMDMIFHRGNDDVFGFRLRKTYGNETEVFCASYGKIEEESKACKHKTKAERQKWLDGIKKAEARIWQEWIDGEVYGICIQTWNADERIWNGVDGAWNLFGWDDVVEALKNMDLTGIDVFCVSAECGNSAAWKDEYKEVDI